MPLNLYIQTWEGKYGVVFCGQQTEEEARADFDDSEEKIVAYKSFDGEGRVGDAAEVLAAIFSLSDVAGDFEEIFTWIANAAAEAKAAEIAKRITG